MAEYNYPRDFTSSRSATELWPNISLQANLCQENRFDLLKDFTFRMADDQYQPSRIINAIQVPGNSCSGPSTNTDEHSSYRSSSGPITEKVSRRFEPHATDVGLQRTGKEKPETAADAKPDQSEKEDEAPGQTGATRQRKQYHRKEHEYIKELQILVKRWKNAEELPSYRDTLEYALEFVEIVREAVYDQHRLRLIGDKSPAEASQSGKKGKEKRDEQRDIFKELSRYYRVEKKTKKGRNGDEEEGTWKRPDLLREVIEDMKVLYPPQDFPPTELP